jgi:SPP1 gp7 family putative phage head morphogenesis protein
MFSSKDYRLILRDRLIARYGKNYNKIIAGRTIKIPSIPISYELEYERKLISFYKENLLKNILNRALFRIKQYNLDSLEGDLENDIDDEVNQFNNKLYNLYPVIQETGNKVFNYHTSKYEYFLKIALGVSVLGFQEYQSTKQKISKKSIKDYVKNFFFNPKEESFNTKDFVDSWAKENVNLIKGATDDIKNKLKSTIARSFRDGSRSSELFDEIKKITNYGDNRVRLIARDQTSKLYGQLNRQRSQDLGLDSYIWRGVLDERERRAHIALEGKIRKWGEEEFDPGDEIRCRCTGESIITEDSFDFS